MDKPKTYDEAVEVVTSIHYMPIKSEGAPCHPDWVGIGCNPQDTETEWYKQQLAAYIAHTYPDVT